VLVVLVCSGYFTASRVERTRNLKLEESYFGVKCLNFRKTGCCSNGLLNMQGLYTKNTGKIPENTGENTGIVYRKYRESHRNHSGEQIVIHQGRKSVTVSGNKKVWILFSKTPKNVWVKNKQKFFAGFLGDFYMFAVISICVGV
jgi:hypothetical protein